MSHLQATALARRIRQNAENNLRRLCASEGVSRDDIEALIERIKAAGKVAYEHPEARAGLELEILIGVAVPGKAAA